MAVGTCLLVFACFTLASSGYLSWLYHLIELVPPSSVDVLTMGAGYACQGVGIAIVVAVVRIRPELMGRTTFAALVALHLACAAPASISESLAGTLVFGYAMNVLCGVISAFYLLALAGCVQEERRGIAFGGGYACSIVASWLVSLVPAPIAGMSADLLACAAFSALAVVVAIAMPILAFGPDGSAPGRQGERHGEGGSPSQPLPPGTDGSPAGSDRNARSLVAFACITVLLMSMVKNVGFNFPTADIGAAIDLELSRLFYAAGLVIAGVIFDKSRKYGAVLCMAGLIMPFALMALSGEPVPSVALWAVGYFLYGFFQVFRIVLFADLAMRQRTLFLAGFGLMLGRFGDALGTTVGISLGSSAIALVTVTAMLFVATVLAFYQMFQSLYMQAPLPAKSELEVFDAFAARYELSPREREMLRHVLDGETNAEAAAALFVSESTVKFHIRNLLKKTGCKNRTDLLAKYAADREA